MAQLKLVFEHFRPEGRLKPNISVTNTNISETKPIYMQARVHNIYVKQVVNMNTVIRFNVHKKKYEDVSGC